MGGAGTGATDTASVDGATEAYLGSQGVVTANKGTVTVESMSSSTAIVNTSCGSGALVAGDTSDATAEIGRNTLADVGQGAQVTAQGLTVEAHSTTMNAEATSLLGTVGLAGGGMSESARATVSGDVDAYIGAQQSTASNGDQTRINISGSVAITAKSDAATAYADTIGGSGSVIIAVTLMSSTANITGSVLAYVGYLGSPSGPFRASFHAGSLDVAATATARDATATSNPVAVGLVGGGDGTNNPHQNSSTSAATVSGDVTAFLAPAGANPGSSPIFKLDVSGGDVTVNATSYSQALGELVGGSGALGITVTYLGADATQSLNTDAYVGDDVELLAHGVDVEATDSLQKAISSAQVLASALIAAGGNAFSNATTSGGTSASIGQGSKAFVTGGYVQVSASSDPYASSTVVIATGAGIAGGREANTAADVTARGRQRPRISVTTPP